MILLAENEIEVIESTKRPKDAEEGEERRRRSAARRRARASRGRHAEEGAPAPQPRAECARGADPVKLYLKKMGSVSLLTREGEVEIAKRIEEGEVEILRALLASKLGTLAIVDLGERLETQRTKVKDVIRGVDEEVSADDEKKYLDKVLNAISKVKSLVNYQEKMDEKLDSARRQEARREEEGRDPERSQEARAPRRERFPRHRLQPQDDQPAFGQDQGATGSAARSILIERKKIYDFLGHQGSQADARDRRASSSKGPETHPGALQRVRRQRAEARAAHPDRRRDLQEDRASSKKKPASRSTSFAAFTTR